MKIDCDKFLSSEGISADIIVPSYNRPEKLANCLNSLVKQSFKKFRVLCVLRPTDRASNDIADPFKKQLNLEILPITRDGVVAAENLGISKTIAPFILFIDDDAMAPIDWVERILRLFHQSPYPVAVGGRDFVIGSPEQSSQKADKVGQLTYYGKLFGNHHKISEGRKSVDTLKGVNMAVRRPFMHFLDPQLHSSIELGNGSQWELDLFLKLRKYGPILFDPSICVDHDSNHSHFVTEKVQVNDAHNLAYVYCKHFDFARKIVFGLYATLIGNSQIIGILKGLTLLTKAPATIKKFLLSQQGLFKGIETYLNKEDFQDKPLSRPTLYICPNGFLGGAERFVLNLGKAHNKEFNPLIVFFEFGPAVKLAQEYGIPTIVLKHKPKLSSPLKLFKAVWELKQIFKSLDPLIIHCTMAYSMILKGLTRYHKCPTVWFQHGPVGGLLDFLASLFKSDKILFNSLQLQEMHQKLTPTFKNIRGEGQINLGVLPPGKYKESIGKQKQVTFASIGRISPIKGQDQIISAYHTLLTENPSFSQSTRLLIVGSPTNARDKTYHESLFNLVSERAIEENVEFIPHQNDLSSLYEMVDIFIHAPKFYEPFGLSVAEAMLTGSLVIGPSKGGTSVFLKNEETGICFDSLANDSVDQLCNKMHLTYNWLKANAPEVEHPRSVSVAGPRGASGCCASTAKTAWSRRTRRPGAPFCRGPEAAPRDRAGP